jgi:hypothetical protein
MARTTSPRFCRSAADAMALTAVGLDGGVPRRVLLLVAVDRLDRWNLTRGDGRTG